MEISKYNKAMQFLLKPKYLTKDFIIQAASDEPLEAFDDTIVEDSLIKEVMPYQSPKMQNVMPSFKSMEDPRNRQIELADGGRVGLEKGSKPPKDNFIIPINPMMEEGIQDPSKRGFLKGAGAVGIGAVAFGTGLLKLVKKGSKKLKDIEIDLSKLKGDWEPDYDGGYIGGYMQSFGLKATTKKGEELLAKLAKEKKIDVSNKGDYTGYTNNIDDASIDALEEIKNKTEYSLSFEGKKFKNKEEASDFLRGENSPWTQENPYQSNANTFLTEEAEHVTDLLAPKPMKQKITETLNDRIRKIERESKATGGAVQREQYAEGKGFFSDLIKENIAPEYRMYAKSILPGGKQGNVDESYFTEDFKKDLRQQSLTKFNETGKLKGSVGELDTHFRSGAKKYGQGERYDINKITGLPSSYATLGSYNYEVNPDNLDVKIKDKYDWNPAYGKNQEGKTGWVGNKKGKDVSTSMIKNYLIEAVKTGEMDLGDALELIGNYLGPKASKGEGINVDIDIPTRDIVNQGETFATGGRVGLESGKENKKLITEFLNSTEQQIFSNFGKKISSGFDPTDVLQGLPEKEYQIMKGAMSKVGNLVKMGVRAAPELLVGTGPIGAGITAALTVPFMIADLAEGKRFSEALQNQASELTFGLIPEADKRIIEEIGGPEAGIGFEIQQNIDKLESLREDLRESESKPQEDMMDPEAGFAQSTYLDNTRKELQNTIGLLIPYLNQRGELVAPEYNAYLRASNKSEQERAYRKGIGDLQTFNGGFDEMSIPEEGPFQQDINKLLKKQEQLEKSYYKKSYPSVMQGTVGEPVDDIINRNYVYAIGGRVGLEKGSDPLKLNTTIPIDPMTDSRPQDPGKRDFLKGVAGVGLGVAALGTGIFKIAKAVKPVVGIAEIVKGTTAPSWLEGLITKILKEGTEVKMSPTSTHTSVKFKNPETGQMEQATLITDTKTKGVTIEYSSDNILGETIQLEVNPQTKIIYDSTGNVKKIEPTGKYKFQAVESEPRVVSWDNDVEMDGENVVSKIKNLNSNISGLKSYATGGKGINKKIAREKDIATRNIEENPHEFIENKYGPGPDYKDLKEYYND